jgi:hypothetical protein
MSAENHNGQKTEAREALRPQLVHSTAKRKPVSAATAMNRHIRAAVIRLVAHSPFEFKRFANVARYAGTREDLAIAVLGEHIRELEARISTPPPQPPTLRRVA